MGKFENRLPRVLRNMEKRVQTELNVVAEEGKQEIVDRINSGASGIIETDTGGLAASIYTVFHFDGRERSGYGQAVAGMQEAMLEKYGPEHIQERTLGPARFRPAKTILKSAVASSSKVMTWWEEGHYNRFLKTEAQAPHFRPMAHRRSEGSENITRRFRGILK